MKEADIQRSRVDAQTQRQTQRGWGQSEDTQRNRVDARTQLQTQKRVVMQCNTPTNLE